MKLDMDNTVKGGLRIKGEEEENREMGWTKEGRRSKYGAFQTVTKRDVQGSVGRGEKVQVITGPYESTFLLIKRFIKRIFIILNLCQYIKYKLVN